MTVRPLTGALESQDITVDADLLDGSLDILSKGSGMNELHRLIKLDSTIGLHKLIKHGRLKAIDKLGEVFLTELVNRREDSVTTHQETKALLLVIDQSIGMGYATAILDMLLQVEPVIVLDGKMSIARDMHLSTGLQRGNLQGMVKTDTGILDNLRERQVTGSLQMLLTELLDRTGTHNIDSHTVGRQTEGRTAGEGRMLFTGAENSTLISLTLHEVAYILGILLGIDTAEVTIDNGRECIARNLLSVNKQRNIIILVAIIIHKTLHQLQLVLRVQLVDDLIVTTIIGILYFLIKMDAVIIEGRIAQMTILVIVKQRLDGDVKLLGKRRILQTGTFEDVLQLLIELTKLHNIGRLTHLLSIGGNLLTAQPFGLFLEGIPQLEHQVDMLIYITGPQVGHVTVAVAKEILDIGLHATEELIAELVIMIQNLLNREQAVLTGRLPDSHRLQVTIELVILLVKLGKNLTGTLDILTNGITGGAERAYHIIHREHTGSIAPVNHLRNRRIIMLLGIAWSIGIAYL